MPQKGKIPVKEKIRIIEEYLAGRIGNAEARERGGIGGTTLRRWINLYQMEGPKGFQPSMRNRVYPAAVKEWADKDYLDGKGSLAEICGKYKIKEDNQLRCRIKIYNRHEEFRTLTGGSRMTEARKKTGAAIVCRRANPRQRKKSSTELCSIPLMPLLPPIPEHTPCSIPTGASSIPPNISSEAY